MSYPQHFPASCPTADETAEATPDGQTLVPFTGTLHVKLVSGRFGLFPVGTLYTAVGSFTVRDEWLKALDEGEHEGVFQVAELVRRFLNVHKTGFICAYPAGPSVI